jgi:hypothetical protein
LDCFQEGILFMARRSYKTLIRLGIVWTKVDKEGIATIAGRQLQSSVGGGKVGEWANFHHNDRGAQCSSNSSNNSSSSEATPLALLKVASFLRRELPIRFAHRINDLGRVPLLRHTKSVREVRSLYVTSFLGDHKLRQASVIGFHGCRRGMGK